MIHKRSRIKPGPELAAGGRKRVLVVAYFFPPLGGGGVQRTLKHVRYLPAMGWDPIVIAPRKPGYEIRDEPPADSLSPGLVVERSFIFEPWWPVFRRLQAVVRSARRFRPAASSTPGAPPEQGAPHGRAVRFAALVFFPDEHLTWIPFAVRSALRSHRREPASAIYSTSPPITGHLIGGIVARLTGLPWVADFRDPWIGNSFLPALPGPHVSAQRWIERWFVCNASAVITATPSLTAMLRDRYPSSAARISTITNGYDAEEIETLRPIPRNDGFIHLVYTGSVYGGVLDTFLAGLKQMLDQEPAWIDRLRVEFIGWLDAESSSTARRYLADPGLTRVVSFAGHRPRREAMAAAASADIALYLLPDDPRKALFIGGKLFEYLGLGLPVLAVAPQGDAREVLASLGTGVVADPTPDGVASGLQRILESRPRRGPVDPEGRYDRRTLARALAECLDRAQSSNGN